MTCFALYAAAAISLSPPTMTIDAKPLDDACYSEVDCEKAIADRVRRGEGLSGDYICVYEPEISPRTKEAL